MLAPSSAEARRRPEFTFKCTFLGSRLSSPHRSEFYEPNALMMEEEGAVIAGLLVGLNVIDANLCMKGEDLDSQVVVLSLSLPPLLRHMKE